MKIKGNIPKPRDPYARSLGNPQYRKRVEVNKKERQRKQQNKHKGRNDFLPFYWLARMS